MLGLLVLVRSPLVEPRVRLNSIRTVVLREGPAVPANRSWWESSVDLKLHRCMSDLECPEGSFCHIPATGPAHSRCRTCRRSGKRCHRDGMCCRDDRCLNNVCVPDAAVAQSIPDGETKMKGWRQRKRMSIKGASGKGQVGDPCVRSSDCSGGLCCARHFWTRICKPLLQEGQVCTRQRRKGHAGLELFQRCPCGGGLDCRLAPDPRPRPPPSSPLLAEAARSKFTAPSSTFRSKAASARLHMCLKV
ncbi:hypothetical protein OJAV_G00185220 [Oryzias javanicus]|uniref:Dickkopf N-terminal cysteine-rich domain-containing protein n=1 Tax=Oryzias javanicus TaxID=123683 RepID=A0A437CDJ5_ORYJA|nr:hypothetical protein OJAV_G00185220 [Oryzias javanicus]